LPFTIGQVVVLDRSEWAAWLDPQTSEKDLLKPSPTKKVEKGTQKLVATAGLLF
jgi:putative SOS response-associated peptidase YedK